MIQSSRPQHLARTRKAVRASATTQYLLNTVGAATAAGSVLTASSVLTTIERNVFRRPRHFEAGNAVVQEENNSPIPAPGRGADASFPQVFLSRIRSFADLSIGFKCMQRIGSSGGLRFKRLPRMFRAIRRTLPTCIFRVSLFLLLNRRSGENQEGD